MWFVFRCPSLWRSSCEVRGSSLPPNPTRRAWNTFFLNANLFKCQRLRTSIQMWSPTVIIERLKCEKEQNPRRFRVNGSAWIWQVPLRVTSPLTHTPEHSDCACIHKSPQTFGEFSSKRSGLNPHTEYPEGDLWRKRRAVTPLATAGLFVCLNPFHTHSLSSSWWVSHTQCCGCTVQPQIN